MPAVLPMGMGSMITITRCTCGAAVSQYYRTAVGKYTRERNLLAHPTLDMYLPLSKFESIQRVYIALPGPGRASERDVECFTVPS